MTYHLTVAGVERDLTLCPVTDDLYIAGFIVFGDPELTTSCAEAMLKVAPEYDYIITAEAKGIPLAHEMARLQGNQKYFVARKKPKAYMSGVFEVTVNSITTKGEQKLYLDTADAALIKGKKILLVDDVVTTGESIGGLEKLVTEAGGIVCGRLCVLAEDTAADRDDLIYLERLPVFNPDGTQKG